MGSNPGGGPLHRARLLRRSLDGLIGTAGLNGVDPLAWLTDVLVRIADLPQFRLHELLPWEWIRLCKTPLVQEAA